MNFKRIQAAKREQRLEMVRSTETRTIQSKVEKVNDPRRQRKSKSWLRDWA